MSLGRTIFVAAIALAVAACTDTPTATESVDGLAFAKGGGPSARGSGHLVDDRPADPAQHALRTFSFVAHSNGGQFQIKNRSFDAKLHGSVECVTVVGNQAWFAGTVTQSDFDPIPVGSIRAFTVVDNGEGQGDPPDQIANSVRLNVISAQDWCNITPVRLLFDIEQGNIQVH